MNARRLVTAEPLTREAFAPFGEVIDTRGGPSFPINQGRTQRFNALATQELMGDGGRGILSIFRGDPPDPLEVTLMERHPLGSQAFVPLNRGDFFAVVAPPGEFQESAIKVFLVAGGRGVNYHAGTWHAPLLPLVAGSEYLVADRAGPGANCDEVKLVNPVTPVKPEE